MYRVETWLPVGQKIELSKGLFTLNAILVRFVVVRNFIRFLTQAVDLNIFHTIQTKRFYFLPVVLRSTLQLYSRMLRKVT